MVNVLFSERTNCKLEYPLIEKMSRITIVHISVKILTILDFTEMKCSSWLYFEDSLMKIDYEK